MRKFLIKNKELFQRLEKIEKRQSFFEIDAGKRFEKIFDLLENKHEKKEGVFYEGEIFDAYSFVSDLIKQANKRIIIETNYKNFCTFFLGRLWFELFYVFFKDMLILKIYSLFILSFIINLKFFELKLEQS